jgi:hypothetical protein
MDIVKRLRQMHTETGMTDFFHAAEEIAQLRQELEDITRPIAKWSREAERDGLKLNGGMASQLADDPETYKSMAKAALARSKSPKTAR